MDVVGIELEALWRRLSRQPKSRATLRPAEGESKDPFKLGGRGRDRTDDLIVANDALSQLSYTPFLLQAELILAKRWKRGPSEPALSAGRAMRGQVEWAHDSELSICRL